MGFRFFIQVRVPVRRTRFGQLAMIPPLSGGPTTPAFLRVRRDFPVAFSSREKTPWPCRRPRSEGTKKQARTGNQVSVGIVLLTLSYYLFFRLLVRVEGIGQGSKGHRSPGIGWRQGVSLTLSTLRRVAVSLAPASIYCDRAVPRSSLGYASRTSVSSLRALVRPFRSTFHFVSDPPWGSRFRALSVRAILYGRQPVYFS